MTLFSLKYGALLLLVAQNTFLVLLMRISRTTGGNLYASSTAVVCMEILKLVTCIGVVAWQRNGYQGLMAALREEMLNEPMEVLKLTVPSVLYVVQNNLLYFALSHLDAATYLVGYQLKILTTAIFSTLMLGKVLTTMQWISLALLTGGVSLAQLHASNNQASAAKDISDVGTLHTQNSFAGFVAVFLAACTSGFSGIYFEKILKGSKTSLWMRNIQMGSSSILLALISVFVTDFQTVRTNGFFYGYTNTVIAVILLQALGGLVVAVVVKYADNILKGFAASFSIITSCIISYFFLDFQPSTAFVMGSILVLSSSYIYEKGLPSQLSWLSRKYPWLLKKVGKVDDVSGPDSAVDVRSLSAEPRDSPEPTGKDVNVALSKKLDDNV